jgi:hypothetical protein
MAALQQHTQSLIFAKNKQTDSKGGRGTSDWHDKVVDSGEECHHVGWSTWGLNRGMH